MVKISRKYGDIKYVVYTKVAAGGHLKIDFNGDSNDHHRIIRVEIARNDTSLVILAHLVLNMTNFILYENGIWPPS